jgi:phosphoenolpyruvate carboxykinase (ATP)
MSTQAKPPTSLEPHGIANPGTVHWNLGVPALYEHSVLRREGLVAEAGPLVCRTGQHTGRSPNDKFITREAGSEGRIWWGKVNQPLEAAQTDLLHRHLLSQLAGKDLFVQDCYAGADPTYRLPVRVITEYAWHSLFARTMFLPGGGKPGAPARDPQFVIIDAPSVHADPRVHGTRSETFIVINFAKKVALIGGTAYAGEIKKSVFSILNYLLPLQNVMPMHCSANVGADGDVALFFGLSGTGKTTLSSDPDRRLVGDDEHGWSERGVFNFEGGCYAKMIRLSEEAEPQIYATTRRFGTVLENVAIDPDSRVLDLDDESATENTRGAYPIGFIGNTVTSGQAGHPRNIVMLTADAFGVLPPIARLTPAGAMYHFLSGYTAKVAGTERGVTEPKATFSTCFGAPFLPLYPEVYAKFLGDRIAEHDVRVWLVNTGWSGGPYGVGARMKIAYTRAIIRAALSGALDRVDFAHDGRFNLDVPTSCPGVPADVLAPRATWSDTANYDRQAARLAKMFQDNFAEFADRVSADVRAAGPQS